MRQPLLLSLALIVAACTPVATPPVADAAPRLTVFDCGRITFADVSAFGVGNDETPVRTLFVPCYLVQHPAGTLLWDAGLPLSLAGQGAVTPEPGMTLRYDRSLLEQLAELGVSADAVSHMALSHLHFDHIGAAVAFPQATLLIQAAEARAAFDQADQYPVFDPQYYPTLAANPRQELAGDHDVFGDGAVIIRSAPGHTPGHQVLQVNLVNTGPVLLSGDLYHFRLSRTDRRVPVFNTDADQTRRSMDRIEALLQEQGASLWLEHDLAFHEGLALAPAHHN